MTATLELVQEWAPQTSEEQGEVLAELECITASPHFRTSRRYPTLLRFVVETALAGGAEGLKERTIGVEVFGRQPTYDTNADPVVRVTAAEVRKRLHQYYEAPENQHRLRIQLSSGSYIPHFVRGCESPVIETLSPPEPVVLETILAPVASVEPPAASRGFMRWLLAVAVVGMALALAGWMWNRPAETSALDIFWAPVLEPSSPVLMSVGPMPMLHPAPLPNAPTPEMGLLDAVQHYNIIPLADATTLSKFSSLMGAKHAAFRVSNAESTSFDELQAGPTILIGALNNQWTTRLSSKLRFGFEDSQDVSSIIDRNAKVQPDWKIYRSKKYSNLIQDYAVIARYQDHTTGKMVVIAGGVGPNGTLAAGEFLTRADTLASLFALAPKGWKGEGLEAVITTEVINGNSGPPRILASQFW